MIAAPVASTSQFRVGRSVAAALLLAVIQAGCSPADSSNKANQATASVPALQAVLQHFDQGWAMRTYWEDGLAEVATYDAERTVYKKKRAFAYTLLTVKEEFNQQFNVKTDDYKRPDLFSVMKVNQFCQIQTEQYPYH